MAVDNFIYQGINRAVSDFAGARACEELINLRPTEGGVIPVRDFSARFTNVSWDKLFTHYTTSGRKYVIVKHTETAVQVYYLDEDGQAGSETQLFSVTGLTSDGVQDVLDHLSFAAAGNVVLLSICAPVAGKYENHAFTWKMDEATGTQRYVSMEGGVPDVTDYDVNATIETASASIARIDGDSEKSQIVESVQAGMNAIQEENPDICFGPIVIAVAFKTTDGKTFWSGGWRVYDPIGNVITDNRFYLDANSAWDWNDHYVDSGFYTNHGGYAMSLIPLVNGGTQGGFQIGPLDSITMAGTKVSLTFPAISGWNKETSIIQSLEVYCSKPVLYLDAAASGDGYYFQHVEGSPLSANISTLILPQVKYEDMELGSQILYHQASITMAALSEGDQTVSLTFGGNTQMGEDTLDVDAGALQRYGRVLAYNARFHYYDSVAKIQVGMPSFNFPATIYHTTEADTDVFVRYADDDQSALVYVGMVEDLEYFVPAYFVAAPSMNIREVITYTRVSASQYYVHRYRMLPSSSYNFSYCSDRGSLEQLSSADAELEAVKAGTSDIITNVETDAINVSEQYNPFVFRVEHSYKAPGNIIDVQPQMAGVVDASYGRDPLNVFTERGLYALTQGSADVLYGTFLPLSNLRAQRGGIPVEAGTFFLADGALWLVSGRRVKLASEAMMPGPHKYIRACSGYRKLAGTDTDFSLDGNPVTPVPDPFYDVSPYLSKVEFKVFTQAGQLSYNRYRMELLISNPAYSYTYVLSLATLQWYKLSKRLWQDEPGSGTISQPGSTTGTITVMDMSSEVSFDHIPRLIHLQSRPFSMGYRYSHIHRIVTMMRAMLKNGNHKVTTSLYGSDDLQHWNLLSYGTWSGKTEFDPSSEEYVDTPLALSQLRTPSAARSWRYYTVCIGGFIPNDPDFPTDIGPVLVDYQPVNRRIG